MHNGDINMCQISSNISWCIYVLL